MSIKLVGITGQTGAGKSTVSNKLAEKTGAAFIDADVLARKVTRVGSPTLMKLAHAFGDDILDEKGTLNRKLLAQRAFAEKKQTALLNSITHPAVTRLVLNTVKQLEQDGFSWAILDAAALFESKEDKLCAFTIAVVAPEDVRLNRIIRRDNITKKTALLRMNAQLAEIFYTSQADFVVHAEHEKDVDAQLLPIIQKMIFEKDSEDIS